MLTIVPFASPVSGVGNFIISQFLRVSTTNFVEQLRARTGAGSSLLLRHQARNLLRRISLNDRPSAAHQFVERERLQHIIVRTRLQALGLLLRLIAAHYIAVVPISKGKDMSSRQATIEVNAVSKWYGSVVAVNDVSFQVYPGITGLLGPNGAGKTTLLHMMAGLASVSKGEVKVLGQSPRNNTELYRRVGVQSEHEAVYSFLTGRQFVEFSADLHGVPDKAEAVQRAIQSVNLLEAQDRPMGTYSRGMRQRMRLAASLVHNPDVMILDEPLNGTDPRQRIEFNDLMRRVAAEGKTILISSHILEEVETLAGSILLMVTGKLAAAGDYRAIRAKLDERPFKVRIVSSDNRALASGLIGLAAVESVALDVDGSLMVLSRNVAVLQQSIAKLAQEKQVRLLRVDPLDESLESVFSYVVNRS